MSKKSLNTAIAIASSLVFVYLMWSGSISMQDTNVLVDESQDLGAIVAEYPEVPSGDTASTEGYSTQSGSFPKITKVLRVVDGDTFVVSIDDAPVTVRLIGIDTPETVHPNKAVQCFGKEASERLTTLISNHDVVLVTDKTQSTYDKYGRLLSYAYLSDGRSINELMLTDGFAYEERYETPYELHDRYVALEEQAKVAGRGLWAEGVCESEVIEVR